jgi:SAM-dependent methyltransferase
VSYRSLTPLTTHTHGIEDPPYVLPEEVRLVIDITMATGYMRPMNWDECYRNGEVFWDKGAPAPAMKQYLAHQAVDGRALVPGCGRGNEVALAVEHGLDAMGLDIAPTAVAEARALYPYLAERFMTGSLFDPPEEMRGTYDVVLEHTCMSGLTPALRADYRRGIDLTLRRGGLLIGMWFINPALDQGKKGPPFPFSVADLTALFAEGYEIVEDYVPDVSFPGREGRERMRVLRRMV